MSTQTYVERSSTEGSAYRSPALQIERYDRLIEAAETRLAEQEAYVREAALVSGSTAVASFMLQKMLLLSALLREGRQRLADVPGGALLR
jgi:hypothetical protein